MNGENFPHVCHLMTARSFFMATLATSLFWMVGPPQVRGGEAAPATVGYAAVQVISNASSVLAAEKAAKVLPRPIQTAWMRLERTFFLHFGLNPFNGVEWGTGRENPSVFKPTALDD